MNDVSSKPETMSWTVRASMPAPVTTIAAHQPLLDIAERHIVVTQSNWEKILRAFQDVYALGMTDVLKRQPNPALRADVKEWILIEMMKRPEGATIEQLAEVTGWRHNTILGLISMFRTQQGLTIETRQVSHVAPGVSDEQTGFHVTDGGKEPCLPTA